MKRIIETFVAPVPDAAIGFSFDSEKQRIRTRDFMLSCNPPDCFCRIDTGEVIRICAIFRENGIIIIRGQAYHSLRNVYESPCPSSEL